MSLFFYFRAGREDIDVRRLANFTYPLIEKYQKFKGGFIMIIIKTDIELLEDKARLLEEYRLAKREWKKYEGLYREYTDIWHKTEDPVVKKIARECRHEVGARMWRPRHRAAEIYDEIQEINKILIIKPSKRIIGSIYDGDYRGELDYDRITLYGIGGVRL